MPLAGALVPGAQPPAVVVDGAQLTVPIGPGLACDVVLAGVTAVVGRAGLVSVPEGEVGVAPGCEVGATLCVVV